MNTIASTFEDFFQKPSAYYMAAGIDLIQPVLRLSHLLQDFIFVTTDCSDVDLDAGFRQSLDNFDEDLPGVLQLVDSGELPLSFVGMGMGQRNRQIPFPACYDADFRNHYIRAFSRHMNLRPRVMAYLLCLQFPGGEKHYIRALHLIGFEGVATYHQLFLSKHPIGPVPEIFISIQSGLWEHHPELMGMMVECHFDLNLLPPRLWIRGNWAPGQTYEIGGYYPYPIGEFVGWSGPMDVFIPGVSKSGRSSYTVQAFGFLGLWNDMVQEREIATADPNLTITMKLGRVRRAQEPLFDITPYKRHAINEESGSSPEAWQLAYRSSLRKFVPYSHSHTYQRLLFSEQLELIRMHYAVMASQGGIECWRRQAIPVGYEAEAFEALERFADSFVSVHGVRLHIELVYKNILDFSESIPGLGHNLARG